MVLKNIYFLINDAYFHIYYMVSQNLAVNTKGVSLAIVKCNFLNIMGHVQGIIWFHLKSSKTSESEKKLIILIINEISLTLDKKVSILDI